MTPHASRSICEPPSSECSGALCGGERPRSVLLLGRERVRDVLEPHLGAAHALERANNIAQALAQLDAQPDAVAFEMLRQLPGEARKKLASAVRAAWLDVEFREFRARRSASPSRVEEVPASTFRARAENLLPSAGSPALRERAARRQDLQHPVGEAPGAAPK